MVHLHFFKDSLEHGLALAAPRPTEWFLWAKGLCADEEGK